MRWLFASLLFIAACGGDETKSPPPLPNDCAPPSRLIGNDCRAPGIQDNGCEAGTWLQSDGTCLAAGIDSCAEGFEKSGDGCAAILPAQPCAPGMVALPGDTSCHELVACGSGPWGDIPTSGDTVYVDQSFVGVSDGSEMAPWTTIVEGVTAAPTGAIVAIAAGSYAEDLIISNTVALWGVCPALVEITGVAAVSNILITSGGDDSEIHALTVRPIQNGIVGLDVHDVLIQHVAVRDAPNRGINFEDSLGPASAIVEGSLIETTGDIGLALLGTDGTVRDTVVRNAGQRGLSIRDATVTTEHLVVEDSGQYGFYIEAADVSIDRTVVRRTVPDDLGQVGVGINAQNSPPGVASVLSLSSSLIEANQTAGVAVLNSEAVISGTTIRTTTPQLADGLFGDGIFAGDGPQMNVAVTSCVIEDNQGSGIRITGGEAALQSLIVRGTQPELNQWFGYGIRIELGATAFLEGGLVEDAHGFGVLVSAAQLSMEGSVVRDTEAAPQSGNYGRGIQFQSIDGVRALGTLIASLIERNNEIGIGVVDADVAIVDVLQRNVIAVDDDSFGDGGLVGVGGAVALAFSHFEGSPRAGFSNFGSSLAVGGTRFECNAIQLLAEPFLGVDAALDDIGLNSCGCGAKQVACKASSTGVDPPMALEAPTE